jgi:putative addiction module component (TIGR02574 family)
MPIRGPGFAIASKSSSEHTDDMPVDALDQILALPIAERLRLVEEIRESILASPELLPLTDAQRRELDRRLALHKDDPEAAEPWEVVRSRLFGSE